MKKFGIFCAAALAMGLMACDDSIEPGKPQVNPQEPIMAGGGVAIRYEAGFSDITLDSYVDKQIPVLTYTLQGQKVEGEENSVEYTLPENAVMHFELEMAKDQGFGDAESITLVGNVENGVYSATFDDFNAAITSLYGISPLQQNVWVRVAPYMVVNGSELVRIGGEGFYLGQEQIKVLPIDKKLPVEASYYLTTSLENYTTTLGDAAKFSHSADHQYNDPNFSIVLDVKSEDLVGGKLGWKVVPASQLGGDIAKCYGVELDKPAATSGNLVLDGAAGEITSVGKYQITVNMLDLTYSVRFAYEELYTVGNYNGWGWDFNFPLTTNNYVNYAGYVYINGDWKVTGQKAWGGLELGYDSATEHLVMNGGGNIPMPAAGAGAYYAKVDLTALTLETVPLATLGVVGGFNDWGGTPDPQLTPSADYRTWSGDVTFDSQTEWKIRANNEWAVSFGGELDNMYMDGPNLKAEAGTYRITIDFSTVPYTATMVKK